MTDAKKPTELKDGELDAVQGGERGAKIDSFQWVQKTVKDDAGAKLDVDGIVGPETIGIAGSSGGNDI